MDFVQLYTTTTGRIGRKTWWLGVIGLAIIGLIISVVMVSILGAMGLMTSGFGQGLASLALVAIFFVPYKAMTYKRLHDRNRPENLFWIFIGPSIVSAVLMMLGISGSVQSIEMLGTVTEGFKPNMLGNLVNLVSTGIAIWALIELGFLKGDAGANAHGPDPVA